MIIDFCRKRCQQENHEAQDRLDYTAKQLNLLSAEIKDKIKQMTEEVERKVCQMDWLIYYSAIVTNFFLFLFYFNYY